MKMKKHSKRRAVFISLKYDAYKLIFWALQGIFLCINDISSHGFLKISWIIAADNVFNYAQGSDWA